MTRTELLQAAAAAVTQDRAATYGPVDGYASRRKWRNPSATKTYYAWRNMRQRCWNPKSASFADYGGRGVTVCVEWADNYDQFFDDMGEAPDGLTLERLDVNAGYSKQNCIWADWGTQARNRRNNRILTYNGESHPAVVWAERAGLSLDTLHHRLGRMPLELALSSGSLRRKLNETHGSRSQYGAGCRCLECRNTHNARMRNQRAAKGASA